MARKTFQDLLVEQQGKTVVFAFGRFNPPTIGHEKLLDKVVQLAQRNRAEARIYPSLSQDNKKNPLSVKDRVKFLKMMTKFPKMIVNNKVLKTPGAALEALAQEGFETVVIVVGGDRVKDLNRSLGPFSEKLGIKNFQVISAGIRDLDVEGATGMSSSKMRAAASDGNFTLFEKGISKKINVKFKKQIFQKVRKSLGLKKINEEIQRPNIVKLNEVDFCYFNKETTFKFTDSLGFTVSNMKISEVKLCDPNIDYEKASKIAQTANRAWLGNIFHISEDNFLYGDLERFVALLSRDPKAIIRVRRIKGTIQEIFQSANNYSNEVSSKLNCQFEEVINENI